MVTSPEDWTVWGDDSEPVMETSEEEAKEYVEKNTASRPDLYLSDPRGHEWEYQEGKWIDVG